MTYNVFGGTLNLSQSQSQFICMDTNTGIIILIIAVASHRVRTAAGNAIRRRSVVALLRFWRHLQMLYLLTYLLRHSNFPRSEIMLASSGG